MKVVIVEVLGSIFGPDRIIAKDVKIFIHSCSAMSDARQLKYCLKQAQHISDKGRATKELVVSNISNVSVVGPAKTVLP